MFSQVEELLPVISFGSKKDSDSEKKHAEFVAAYGGARLHRAAGPPPGRVVHARQAGGVKKDPAGTGNFMHIVDRRLNPSGKNLANRQRFMRRAKSLIRKAVHESSASRSIKDADQAGEVALPRRACTSRRSTAAPPAASATICCPATSSTSRATRSRARRAAPAAAAPRAARDGDGQDDFRFALSRDEFVDLFLEDLELPDLAKRRVVDTESVSWHRAGYSVTGSPANLALLRTVRNSLSRRIALKRPKPGRAAAAARRDRRAAAGRRRERARAELEEELSASCAAPG